MCRHCDTQVIHHKYNKLVKQSGEYTQDADVRNICKRSKVKYVSEMI